MRVYSIYVYKVIIYIRHLHWHLLTIIQVLNTILIFRINDYVVVCGVQIEKSNNTEHKALLEKCAATALSSKLIHQQKDFFSKIVVDAVLSLDELLPLNMIGIKKVQGGALEVSLIIREWILDIPTGKVVLQAVLPLSL